MEQFEEIKGTIDKFLYQNLENGFSIFIVRLNSKDKITAKGYLLSVQPEQDVYLYGKWLFHQKFGRQFEVIKFTANTPTSINGLKKYLGSGMIKGIGKVYAEKLVNHFGTDVLNVIEKNPQKLSEVDGIGEKRVERIINSWKDQKEISNIMVFLQEKGVSTGFATKIYKAYGQNSITVVTQNPYRLADEIWGIGFKSADKIALNLGIEKNSTKRIKSGIIFAISNELNNGHIYVEFNSLKNKIAELLGLEPTGNEQLFKQSFNELYSENKIKIILDNNEHFITLTQYYFTEKGVATKVKTLTERPSTYKFDLDKIYKTITKNSNSKIQLNEDQQRGIMACLQNKLTIVTGGPGTGKTTLIKSLLSILDENKITYKLAAPTGRAAKRIIESTGRHSLTIHRLLEFDFHSMKFNYNDKNVLNIDFLIIDEASMIDIFIAHSILKALPVDAHLILIGDVDQLPSVGAGNFLNDLIQSQKCTVIRLNQIFRQAQNSLIIINAHKINNGEFPVSYLPDAKRDFILIKEDNPENVINHLREIYNEKLKKYYIDPEKSILLVPMNKGTVGTIKLNHDLQSLLNPHAVNNKQVTHSGFIYKINDRVMQIKNNYEKLVFNGDIGTIEDIDSEDKILLIKFDDRVIEYDFQEIDELVLAYAISIHKSQGSEFNAVIIPIFTQHFTLLARNLIYTAITRAKKLCIFIGQIKALAMAIKNNKSIKRKTFLKEFLTTDLECL